MFFPFRHATRLPGAAALVFALLVLWSSELPAQTEEALVEKARIKMKLQQYNEAAAILRTAREKYPSSVEVAELTAQLYEEAEADAQKLIDAYRELIKAIEMKEVIEGSLSSGEGKLLRETKSKLAKVAEFRLEVDVALEGFITEGIETCRKFAKKQKHTEASFIFQRLNALSKSGELEKALKALAGELKEKANLVKKPVVSPSANYQKARDLLRKARKHFRSGRYDKARVQCKAALEADPYLPEAWAILCDIAHKTNDTAGLLSYGFSYLLFPPEEQESKQAEEIEKRLRKASPDLEGFFKSTAAAADRIAKLLTKTVRAKKTSDVEYTVGQLACLTHMTWKVESAFSKARAFTHGKQIFNGKNLAGWKTDEIETSVSDGCMVMPEVPNNRANELSYTKVRTSGPFELQFHFQVERSNLPVTDTTEPALRIPVWRVAFSRFKSAMIIITIFNSPLTKAVHLSRLDTGGRGGWKRFGKVMFTGPLFEPGRWYHMHIEYIHDRSGTGKLILTLDGEKTATMPVPPDLAPKRTGWVGLGQQCFKVVRFKNIYLKP